MPTFEEIQEEISGMLDVADEDLTDSQREAMDAYLNELANQEVSKVDGFAQFIRLESERAEACRKEAQRLSARARAAESRIGFLKNKYLEIMSLHGLKKISGNAYILSVRESKVVSAPTGQKELGELHEQFPVWFEKKVEFKPDKKTIKEALLGGLEVPGCQLVSSYSLQIR